MVAQLVAHPPVTSIPDRMTLRFSFLQHTIVTAVALLIAATTAEAQVSRDWSVCFSSGVLSCTDLFLTTAPTLGGAGGARDGTQMSLMIRQRDRGVPTGLLGFAFGFGAASADQIGSLSTTPTPIGGAQLDPSAPGWTLGALRSTSSLNFLFGYNAADPSQSPSPTAWIGGCLSPSSNQYWSVTNVACGNGQAFSFQWTTPVLFDADLVETVEVDVREIDQQALSAGDGGGYCQGPASGGAGVGFDGYDPSNAFPCDIGRAEPLVATVPEPETVVLLAAGLAILAGCRQRMKRLRLRAV